MPLMRASSQMLLATTDLLLSGPKSFMRVIPKLRIKLVEFKALFGESTLIEGLLARGSLLVGDSGIRRVYPERGRQCDEMVLFLHEDIAKALSDSKFIELVCLLYTASVLTNGFLLIL
jgi:hypothetical protein